MGGSLPILPKTTSQRPTQCGRGKVHTLSVLKTVALNTLVTASIGGRFVSDSPIDYRPSADAMRTWKGTAIDYRVPKNNLFVGASSAGGPTRSTR